jgi:D-alanyl-D-alanine carboxypeptidase
MEAAAATQYRIMYDTALADGVEIIPCSGYRNVSRQKSIFDQEISSYVGKGYSYAEAVNLTVMWVLPPGCSEHNTGLSMDITSLGVQAINEDFDTTKEFAWLQDNAHEYGFILRYPSDKQEITGMAYEPWHWRFVGTEPATAMKKSGQCLEEYLGMVH